MIEYYKSGFHSGVINFVEYLKDKSFLCDPDNGFSFYAIDAEELEDYAKEFLDKGEYI